MPFIFTYLLKLSLSMGAVFLFYQLVLRKLTFYNWNRWYLLGYTLLSFFIPFINISLVLQQQQWTDNGFIQWVPVLDAQPVNTETGIITTTSSSFPVWTVLWIIFIAGALVMLVRLLAQLISFKRMMKRSELISDNNMNIYQVNDSIIPFSFGKSIFINRNLHSEPELQEIIRHEFVHVRQRHSIDIIWGELLCLLNWYNPFAWLLKKAIRQNLEFVADNKVLENGIDKKKYQYLLLKVIGNSQFSIANQFNFSSLKKRIAMMNKMKTARVHVIRFLFVLPLLFVLLVAFRNRHTDRNHEPLNSGKVVNLNNGDQAIIDDNPLIRKYTDTVPRVRKLNDKGYYIDIIGVGGNCTVVVKDKNRKEVTRLLLTDWDAKEDYYENLYGEILPPPPAPPIPPTPPAPPTGNEITKAFLQRNTDIKSIGWVFDNGTDNMVALAHIIKKDGSVEKYDLTDNAELAKAEQKYGKLPVPPSGEPPLAPLASIAPVQAIGSNLNRLSDDFEITDKKAEIRLKDGSKEEYDLTNPEDKAKFEKKYGKIVRTWVDGEGIGAPVAIVNGVGTQTVIAPMAPLSGYGATVIDPNGHIITGQEDIILTITKNTTREQLEDHKRRMKDKGVDLTFDNIEYSEKGKLISISGRMKSKEGQSNFSVTDFGTLILAMVRDGERSYFKVVTKDDRVVM